MNKEKILRKISLNDIFAFNCLELKQEKSNIRQLNKELQGLLIEYNGFIIDATPFKVISKGDLYRFRDITQKAGYREVLI